MYPNNYNNQFYIQDLQNMRDRIDKQLQQMTQPKQQQVPITQNFQLAPSPTQSTMRFVNTIDDVNKEFVYGDTPFFSNDMSVMWVKNAKGMIKSYSITEIIEKDEKDVMIESLQMQIEELRKGMISNAKSNNTNDDEPTKDEKPTNVSSRRTSTKK